MIAALATYNVMRIRPSVRAPGIPFSRDYPGGSQEQIRFQTWPGRVIEAALKTSGFDPDWGSGKAIWIRTTYTVHRPYPELTCEWPQQDLSIGPAAGR